MSENTNEYNNHNLLGNATYGDFQINTPLDGYNNGYYNLSSGFSVDMKTIDFKDKVIDIKKLMELDEAEREILMKVFDKYINCNSYDNSFELYENTLNAYGFFTTKKCLKRKTKISNLLKE
jgi:hypothetical protein